MFDIDLIDENAPQVPATPEFWAEIDSHPIFMNDKQLITSDSKAVKALQALKYESEDPNTNAMSYKEDGNHHYKNRDFESAILNYSEGISKKPTDSKLLSNLFLNKALAEFQLRNFGHSIRDCINCLDLDSDNLKAYYRGSLSALKAEDFEKFLFFFNNGIQKFPESNLLIDLYPQYKELVKKSHSNSDVFVILKKMGVKLAFEPDDFSETNSYSVGEQMFWHSTVAYPEFEYFDVISDLTNSTRLFDILYRLFDPEMEPAPWNKDGIYSIEDGSLEMYYKADSETYQLCRPDWTLENFVKRRNFSLDQSMSIKLYVLSKKSREFYKNWIERFFSN